MSPNRRQLLQAAGSLSLSGAAVAATATATATALPPGKPGDFDFLAGEWRIANRRLKAPGDWDEFPGEATVTPILGGVASVEELRIPARGFAGMGLRLLDLKEGVWRDFWVNAKSGVLTPPGMPGHFVDGAGIFESDDEDAGKPIKVRGIWDQISSKSCRWRQMVSRDDGRTWETNWEMAWTRA